MVRKGKSGHQRVVALSDTGLQKLVTYLNEERHLGDRASVIYGNPTLTVLNICIIP
jgi:hypothetical protein